MSKPPFLATVAQLWVVLLPFFAHTCLAQAVLQHGVISGHVVNSTSRPISGVAITLLDSRTLSRQVAHSDADGAYAFTSLTADQYLLLAFHPGYFAEYFNMVPRHEHPNEWSRRSGSPHMFLQGVTLHSGEQTAIADFRLQSSPLIQTMRDQGLLASYSPQERAQLGFCAGTFSADLRYLALQMNNLVSGDAEQVWRYEVAAGGLIAVTPAPTSAAGPHILSAHWTGDTLYVTGIDRSIGRQFNVAFAEQGPPSIKYIEQPSPWPQAEDTLATAGRYKLASTRLHGGATTWTAQLGSGESEKVIAAALLSAPVVNAELPFFFYVPVSYPQAFRDDTVAALDLTTGRQTTQRLPVSTGLQLLAVAQQAGGFLLAYQVMGNCEPVTNQDGEDTDQLNGFAGLPSERQAVHVCFIHLNRPR